MMKWTLIVLAAILCLSTSLLISPSRAALSPAIGQPAPDFALKDTSGKAHALKDYRGQIVIVGFIATQCPISNAYNERMRAIAEEYKARKVAFLGINSNSTEPVKEIREHAAQNNLRFTILKDDGNKVADIYGAERTPEMYVIDEKGVLRYHGRIDNSQELPRVNRKDLREALNEMLAGKAVGVTEAKAFGCAIKRGNEAASSASGSAPAATASEEAKVMLLKPADFVKLKESGKGSVVVMNFWATWCGPCVAEFPEFIKLDEKYRSKGVKIIGLSADDPPDLKPKVVPFLKEQGAKFDNYVFDMDDPQKMIDAVNKEWSGALPITLVFDRQGKLAYQRYGIIDRDQLVAAIESALK